MLKQTGFLSNYEKYQANSLHVVLKVYCLLVIHQLFFHCLQKTNLRVLYHNFSRVKCAFDKEIQQESHY